MKSSSAYSNTAPDQAKLASPRAQGRLHCDGAARIAALKLHVEY
jgi:hypothetical protein